MGTINGPFFFLIGFILWAYVLVVVDLDVFRTGFDFLDDFELPI